MAFMSNSHFVPLSSWFLILNIVSHFTSDSAYRALHWHLLFISYSQCFASWVDWIYLTIPALNTVTVLCAILKPDLKEFPQIKFSGRWTPKQKSLTRKNSNDRAGVSTETTLLDQTYRDCMTWSGRREDGKYV